MSLKISIVTPSLNQGEFLEECIQSVLGQNYPRLEYVVMDGGSQDDSAAIIRKQAQRLHDFRIEPDGGQYEALNRGFALTGGGKADIMGWLNADDKFMPWTFQIVAEIFSKFPQVEWISTLHPVIWGLDGVPTRICGRQKFSAGDFFTAENCLENCLQQESTFWRRSLWERAGSRLDPRWTLAGDFELWARFFMHTHCYGVGTILGGFRMHPKQKTNTVLSEYIQQAKSILIHYRKILPPQYHIRHRAIRAMGKFLGKRRAFMRRGWLAADSSIFFDRNQGWYIEGPIV